jgi:hypothetical protein
VAIKGALKKKECAPTKTWEAKVLGDCSEIVDFGAKV